MPKPQGTDNDLLQIAQSPPPEDEKGTKEAEETRALNESIRTSRASRDEYAKRIFGIKEEGEDDGQ